MKIVKMKSDDSVSVLILNTILQPIYNVIPLHVIVI